MENNYSVPQTILQQLGGNKFVLMTGSKNFEGKNPTATDKGYLRMKLIKNAGNVNYLTVTLDWDDTYTMEFFKLSLTKGEIKKTNFKTFNDVYFDDLQEIFTSVTQLYTSL